MAVIEDGNLYIYVLNVGQADTSIIITPKGNIVIIDAVRPDKLADLLGKLGLVAGSKIEYLVITHPHTDHFQGVDRLLKDYDISSVSLSPFWNNCGLGPPSYRALLNNIENKKCIVNFISGYNRIYPDGSLKTVGEEQVFNEDSFFIELLGPPNSIVDRLERDNKLNANHLSILSRLNWKKFSMIIAGDAQMENWAHFDSEGMLSTSCDILRTAHHGSCNGTQWERLYRLNPKYTIISSDPESRDNLPDLVGTSIFAKYDSSDTSKIVTITSDLGTMRVTVNSMKKYRVDYFRDTVYQKVDLSNSTELQWNTNLTNWRKLLEESVSNLYI